MESNQLQVASLPERECTTSIRDYKGNAIRSISPGDKFLCPGLCGDWYEMTLGDSCIGRSNGRMICIIKYDEWSKTFVVTALIDNPRILNCNF